MVILSCLYYIWWLLINAFLYYAEYDFILRFLAARKAKVLDWFLYVGINCVFTAAILSMELPILLCELIHAGIMYLFIYWFFRCKRAEMITPIIIIFSLSTFMDGISTILMRWAVEHVTVSALGHGIQLFLSVVLALAFFLLLRYVANQHSFSSRQAVSSYLYVLLLPCTFIVWVVRFGFGLDSIRQSDVQFPFADLSLTWALISIFGAAATFFIILAVFEKIVTLSQQETEKALLDNQLKEQKTYLAEAQKREEQLCSFQHDLNNHLTVLSGLLKEKKYSDVEEYFRKLKLSSAFLRRRILTGNSVLDVLLREKIGYAKQNHIEVSCHVSLPDELLVDDMDLCIIVSNALDNAIQSCIKENHNRPDIELTIKARHHFLLIEITNPVLTAAAPVPGTGLKNISRAAEKYQGTMEVQQDNGRFRLSVLLCLDQ